MGRSRPSVTGQIKRMSKYIQILSNCDLIQTQINDENKKSVWETVIILVRDKILNQKRMKRLDAIKKQIEGGLKK